MAHSFKLFSFLACGDLPPLSFAVYAREFACAVRHKAATNLRTPKALDFAAYAALTIGMGALAGCGEQPALSDADRNAVTAIEQQGGKVEASPVRDQEFTTAVTSIDFSGKPMDAHFLSAIGKFPMLKTLKIPKAKITDADLTPLESLHALETVDFSQTPINGSGLRALRYCKIREINLKDTQLNDEGMKLVADMGHHFQVLNLAGTKITDAGLEALKQCGPIESLDLSHTDINGAGLRNMPRSVIRLKLCGTAVNDGNLTCIEEMPVLAELDLAGTPITETSVNHFQAVAEFQNRSYERRKLKILNLHDTKISKSDIEKLQQSHPGLEIKQ